LIYPTAIRSLGAGWMHGIGRFGAIAAPLIGGWLISLHFSQQTLFSAPALPLPIGALAAFGLACLGMARFKGHRLDETAAAESKRAVGAAGVTALPQ
jgi:MFS family permease